jgi:four helix bundle protein
MVTEFEDLKVLKKAEEVSDQIWKAVIRWEPFARDSLGLQLARAADSIGANIAEAFGRFHYGEKIQFLYYARGSLFETKYWINRTQARKLLTDSKVQELSVELTTLAKQLNAFTRDTKNQRNAKPEQQSSIGEQKADYQADEFTPLFSPEDLIWISSYNNDVSAPEVP